MNGKGSKPRPVNRKAWDAGYQAIKWSSQHKRKGKK